MSLRRRTVIYSHGPRGDLSYAVLVFVSVLRLSSTSRGGEFQLLSTTETRGPENDLAFI